MERIHDMTEDTEPADTMDVIGDICERDQTAFLVASIAALPAEERAAIAELYLGGLTFRAVAVKLGVSLGTLERTVARGLARLEKRLDREQGDVTRRSEFANPEQSRRRREAHGVPAA